MNTARHALAVLGLEPMRAPPPPRSDAAEARVYHYLRGFGWRGKRRALAFDFTLIVWDDGVISRGPGDIAVDIVLSR